MAFSSAGCNAWSSNFDPFGLFSKREDEEVPSGEEAESIDDWQTAGTLEVENLQQHSLERASDETTSPSRNTTRQLLSAYQSNVPMTTPSPARARLAKLCAGTGNQTSNTASIEVDHFNVHTMSANEQMSPRHHSSSTHRTTPVSSPSRAVQRSPAITPPHIQSIYESIDAENESSRSSSIEVTPTHGVLSIAKEKELLEHSTSFTTAATSTEDSNSSQGLSDSDSTSTYAKPPAARRKWRCWIRVAVPIAIALIILLIILGGTGQFRRESQATQATQVQTGGASNTGSVGGSDVDSGDGNVDGGDGIEETGGAGSGDGSEESGSVGNGHDTEVPDRDATTASSTPAPTAAPAPTSSPTLPRPVTYEPGKLTVEENGLLLSQGLSSRLIAQRRRQVEYANGELSEERFHRRPDYGATFAVPPDFKEKEKAWAYVSNSELGGPPYGLSGVGALYFDKDGNVIEYKMLLTDTTKNCAGGRTPWNTFISCEEEADIGQVWQVDPFDRRPPETTTMGKVGGRYEAFAYDDRDKNKPRFFVTEDLKNGPTLRWTPDPESIDWDEPWDILTGSGTLEYLILKPDPADNTASGSFGTYEWTTDLALARENAQLYARGTEGIDRKENLLYFVCKTDRLFYILDLDKGTFVMYPIGNVGLFNGEPDQVQRMVNDTQDILYFSEEHDDGSGGIHGRNSKGQFFTIIEGPGYPESTANGLAFSPNGMHMYVCFQDDGVVFDITRDDGYPFHGVNLEVHYHNPPLDHLLRL